MVRILLSKRLGDTTMKQSVIRRRQEAKERNEKWSKLPLPMQLSFLVGRGHKHCRQFQRIKEKIENG